MNRNALIKIFGFALLCLCTFFAVPVFGRAAYASKTKAIQQAEIIAIVEITKVAPTKTKGKGWTYSEVADAKTERVLKGVLDPEVKLYGGENFICAQVRFEPQRFIVFLNKDGELITGANWHLSTMAITGDEAEWFEDDQSIRLVKTPLKDVLTEIESILAKEWPILVHLSEPSRGPRRLLLAHWMDGTTLRANTEGKLEVGHAPHPGPWRMWQGVRKSGFFKSPLESYIVPDASYETLCILQGSEGSIHGWHGVLKRGFGGDIETDDDYRRFVEMWKGAKNALSELQLNTVVPVEEAATKGIFRGYDLAEPAKTPWMNTQEWRDRIGAAQR